MASVEALLRRRGGLRHGGLQPPSQLRRDADWSREPVRHPDTLIRAQFNRRPQVLAFFLSNPRESYLHYQGRCLSAYVSLGAADAGQPLPYSLSPLPVALGADEFAVLEGLTAFEGENRVPQAEP